MISKVIILLIINLLLSNNNITLDEIYEKLNVNIKSLNSAIVPEQKELVSIGFNTLGKEIFLSKNVLAHG